MRRSRLRLIGASLVTFSGIAVIFRIFANWYGRVRARESSEVVERTPVDNTRPTIVIVHGLGGSSYKLDAVLGPVIVPFANVITIDLPGHGGKPASLDGERSIEAQSEWLRMCIEEKLDRRGIKSCFLFGISFGGELLTRLMIDLGRGVEVSFSVDGFIAFEPPYRAEYAKAWQRKMFRLIWIYYRVIRSSVLNGSPTAQRLTVEMVARFVRLFGGVGRDNSALYNPTKKLGQYELFEHLSRYNDDHLDWEQWLDDILAILTYDGAEHISDFPVDVPVLLLSGEDSTDPIVNTVEKLADDLSGIAKSVKVVVIPGAHHGIYEHTDIVAQCIRGFVEDNYAC